MTPLSSKAGVAVPPPRGRRWMATSHGNDMALGNVSLVAALWYCVVETLRGNGPCSIERHTHRHRYAKREVTT